MVTCTLTVNARDDAAANHRPPAIIMQLPNPSGREDLFAVLEPSNPRYFTEGPYGVHDVMRRGLRYAAHDLAPRHPLQHGSSRVSPNSSESQPYFRVVRPQGRQLRRIA